MGIISELRPIYYIIQVRKRTNPTVYIIIYHCIRSFSIEITCIQVVLVGIVSCGHPKKRPRQVNKTVIR